MKAERIKEIMKDRKNPDILKIMPEKILNKTRQERPDLFDKLYDWCETNVL